MGIKIKTYKELIKIDSFEERLNYLKLSGSVGVETFGYDRWLNQKLYHSREWRQIRDKIIVRDNGCDLAMPGYEIPGMIFIHHMNPLGKADILDSNDFVFNPDYLVCVSKETHDAIHYGTDILVPKQIERTPGDTKLW